MEQLTFWSEELLANHSPSLDSDRDWMIHAATWHWSIAEFLNAFDRDGLSGKTSQVCCRLDKDGILVPSSVRWSNSAMGSATECWTLNSAEHNIFQEQSHNDEGVCSLSDILTTGDVPQEFYLSAKACEGILRRAEKRGKKLPEQLELALRQVADSAQTLNAMED